jgi:hypothetical protein
MNEQEKALSEDRLARRSCRDPDYMDYASGLNLSTLGLQKVGRAL